MRKACGIDASMFHICATNVPGHFWKHALTTFAFFVMVSCMLGLCRTDVADIYVNLLSNACVKVVGVLDCDTLIPIPPGGVLAIDRHGKVAGFVVLLKALCSKRIISTLRSAWESMSMFWDHWEADFHDLRSVLLYLSLFPKLNTAARALSRSNSIALVRIRVALLRWFADKLDIYVKNVYVANHNIRKPVPSLRFQESTPEKRKYVVVDPSVVWGLIEQARTSQTSLNQVIKIRSEDPHVGCCTSLGPLWANKLQNMYDASRGKVMKHVSHWHISADGAIHTKHDSVVSAIWSWQTQCGVYGNVQFHHSGDYLKLMFHTMFDFLPFILGELESLFKSQLL